CCQLSLISQPIWLSEKLLFLGEIPRRFDFEGQQPIGMSCENDQWVADAVLDDSALVYQSETGLVIITGCSHSGICNIIEYAKEICQDHRINGVIGGFHLFELDEQLFKTQAYFAENQIKSLYPCHCVSFAVKAKINEKIPVREVAVGLSLIW
ncbi:MAG TPA: MBL fold metallo-hydrolase, partial [Acetobacterium sp.]|nr:MBL fold metallo-hydrolase [Acetobacterium sp.]